MTLNDLYDLKPKYIIVCSNLNKYNDQELTRDHYRLANRDLVFFYGAPDDVERNVSLSEHCRTIEEVYQTLGIKDHEVVHVSSAL